MKQNQTQLLDGLMLARLNRVWLWIGVLYFSLSFLEMVSSSRIWESFKWAFGSKTPLLDCGLLIGIVSTIAIHVSNSSCDRDKRATSVLGWMHACALGYTSLCVMMYSSILFRTYQASAIPNYTAISPVALIQPIFESLSRGMGLYFVVSAVISLISRRSNTVSYPAYGIILLSYFIVWLSINMAAGFYP